MGSVESENRWSPRRGFIRVGAAEHVYFIRGLYGPTTSLGGDSYRACNRGVTSGNAVCIHSNYTSYTS